MLCRRWLFGHLSCRCFATKSVLALYLADALPPWLLGSLADALPSLPLDTYSLGGCFATVA
jgi:hypothetical protein